MPLVALFACLGLAHAGDLRVDVLDVGQGDSILIRTPGGKTILIDAAEDGGHVADQLAQEHVTSLDLVIATHPHADHIGGMKDVVDAVPIKQYWDNGLPHTTQTYENLMADIESKPIDYSPAVVGMVFPLDDGAKLTILNPAGTPLRDTRSDLNANSVVARLDHGKDCFLFVGDSEEPTEQRLLSNGLAQCDVLKVAHHGSQYSSTPAFLAAVQPKIALISVGVGNRYHHPGPDTVHRLVGIGATVYRTDLEGRLTVHSSGHGVTVTTERTADPALVNGGPVSGTPTTYAVAPGNALQAAGQAAAANHAMDPAPSPTKTSAPTTSPAKTSASTATASTAPPAPADAKAKDVAEAACPFPASRSSEVFHEDGCGNAEKISPENLVCYATREAAIAAGKRPAGCCKP